MGHANVQTTMRYLHHKSRADDARLLSAVFDSKKPGGGRARCKTSSRVAESV